MRTLAGGYATPDMLEPFRHAEFACTRHFQVIKGDKV